MRSEREREITKVIKSPPRRKTEGKMLNEIITIYAIIDDLISPELTH